MLTSSFGIRVGQYATISCALGLPPEKPVIPGGPEVITGAISIPTRHIHQVIEMADKGDIEKSILIISKGTGLSVEEIKNADIKYINDFEKATNLIIGEDEGK